MAKIEESDLRKLHPTQLTVGMIVVKDKQAHLTTLSPKERSEFMRGHAMPAVRGPGGRLYVTDHHHLGRAALDAGLATAFFQIDGDLSDRDSSDFWKQMEKNHWVHPLDENGVRHYCTHIPDQLGGLVDDVYRSIAGYVRDAGGYDKVPEAFAEFVWADFFRRSIPIELVRAEFHEAVAQAIPLAKSHRAKSMPGFNGK
ncbi:ParB-like protein [Steroidobacter cummioxidans]|uniref:ParB-like protein n=1 Tax=Steroidobacter cummioxidans TaxID=1803913 RepID=UPI000E317873